MKKRTLAALGIFQIFCLFGGSCVSAIISAVVQQPKPYRDAEIYSIIMLCMLAFIVVIEIVSAFKIHDSTVHTIFTSCSLALSFVFSYDMLEVINPSHILTLDLAAEYIAFIAFHFVMVSHIYLLNFLYGLGINKKGGTGIIIFAVSDCILFAALKGLNLHWVAYIAYIPVLIYFAVRVFTTVVKKKNYDLTFVFIITILAASTGMNLTAFLFSAGVLPFRIYGIDTTYILIINMLYVSIYVAFILRTESQALKASRYKLEVEKMKTRLLREQINPHFIFNSLITVKEAYHTDKSLGDEAINSFSRYLRANVNAMNLDLIPFGEELDNIENYITLINIKRKQPVNIVYNVECDDFLVPVLALQVFVENAVKYAKTNEKKNGYISVSSYKEDGYSVVEIEDNGVGFDVNKIKQTSCGIRNARERFKLLLGTSVEVKSLKGKGTKVKVKIVGQEKIRGGRRL